MLTSDLIRYKITDDQINPAYISRKEAGRYLRVSEDLIGIYRSSVGLTQGEIKRRLEDYESTSTDYRIFRGLAKLLEEKATYSPPHDWDYPQIREEVFQEATKAYPIVTQPDLIYQTRREDVLESIAQKLGVAPQELGYGLYGDLLQNHILTNMEKIIPEELLRRYNLALAQGILYRSLRMRIELFSDYKPIFRYIKLARLIYLIERNPKGGYLITLTGPASLLRRTQKYGVNMALFLPGLLLASKWRMWADVSTRAGLKVFSLDQNCGLHSHYHPEKLFNSKLEEMFAQKFSKKPTEWKMEREGEIIDLVGRVFIPDFTFTHQDGRRASLEIVGFWTPEYLEKKLKKLRAAGRRNLIVAVNQTLNCSPDDFSGPVIFFKYSLKPSQVLEKLEEIGRMLKEEEVPNFAGS